MLKKSLLIISVILFFQTPSWASCKKDTTDNQIKAEAYITELMIKTDLTKRPILYDGHCRNDSALNEVKAAMDNAEKLARAGKNNMIRVPVFKYDGTGK